MISTLGLILLAANVSSVGAGSFHQAGPSWFQPQIYVDLPSTIYAVEGVTNRIYFFNVVRFDHDWSLITNTFTCDKGTSDGTSWTYLPTASDAGTTTLTINVNHKAPFERLFTKTVTLVTRPANYPSNPVSRKVLIVGDSTTAGGETCSKLVTLFSGDGSYTLSEVGPNSGTVSGNAVSMAGISGWTFGLFYTDDLTAWTTLGGSPKTGSPFRFSGAFNFSEFLTANSISMTSGDWVVFNLGINGIFSQTTDSGLNTKAASEISALTNMVANIQSAVSGIRVGVALTIPPNQSEAAFIADYGSSQTLARYQRNNRMFVEALLATFGSGGYGVTLIPINANIDTANNMANGVHPATAGYYQIADAYRAFLKGNE